MKEHTHIYISIYMFNIYSMFNNSIIFIWLKYIYIYIKFVVNYIYN